MGRFNVAELCEITERGLKQILFLRFMYGDGKRGEGQWKFLLSFSSLSCVGGYAADLSCDGLRWLKTARHDIPP